jgi:hypothetical protein
MLPESCEPTDRAAARPPQGLFASTLLAALALVALLAAPCLVGRVYTRDDLGAFHLPLRAFYARQLARGEPFGWTPQLYCGFYLTGEGQLGAYHPLHLLLYRFLPLEAAWAAELLASYPFMLLGTYLFLRRLVGRRDAALFGSLAFTFSGFNLLHFVHPNAIAVVAHIPWLLWMIDVMLVAPNRNRVVAAQTGIALLTGSQILLGYPQYVWFSLLAEGAYGLCVVSGSRYAAARCVAIGDRGKQTPGDRRTPRSQAPAWERFFRKLPLPIGKDRASRKSTTELEQGDHLSATPFVTSPRQLAIAKTAGLLLGGVQLLPTLDGLAHSVRRSVDAAFIDSGSLHPLNLVQLVAPYLFARRVVGQNTHELGLYVGAVPLMLIVWLVVCRRDLGRLRRPALAAGGFGLLAMLLAFGHFGPVYRLQRLLPLVGRFRFPCRYTVLACLCVAVASAVAMVALARQQERGERTPWRRLWPVGIAVLFSVLIAAAGMLLGNRPFIASTPAILAGPLLIGSAAVLLVLAARGIRWVLVGLVLFAAADLGYYGMSYAAYPHAERLDAYVARTTTPGANCDGRVLAEVPRSGLAGLRTGNQITLAGWRRADGYAALEPARKLDYRQLAALRVAGVRWVRRGEATAAIDGLVEHDARWLEVPAPLDRVRLVTRTRPSRDPARDIARIPLESVALVEEPIALPAGPPGTATIVGERPGLLHLRLECPNRQLLVVSESYHPGWRAEVDGRAAPVVPANGDFLGCVVPPGVHEVVLEFRPRSLGNGLLVSGLGLTVVAAMVVTHLIRAAFAKTAPQRHARPRLASSPPTIEALSHADDGPRGADPDEEPRPPGPDQEPGQTASYEHIYHIA